MQRQRRTTIIVVGGALAIASVGYGLGSQAGDGTAIADNNTTEQDGSGAGRGGAPPLPFDRGAPPGLSDLADKLGVDATELTKALRDYHDQHESDRRDEFAAKLAKALGVSTDKVQSAFEGLHAKREGRPGAPGDPGRRGGAGPAPGHPGFGHGHRDRALPLRQLAKALGVSRADLRDAFRQLRAGAENHWKQEQQALAKFLADRFNLDLEKVQDALSATAPPLRSPDRGPRDHPTAL
jgi:transcriptional regulator with XRE-family HTH domain